jgi:cold shock CspA family protein
MANNENLYDYAKSKYDCKDYTTAVEICEELWNNSEKNDSNLLSLYGFSLRKINQSAKFIEIIKGLKDTPLIKNRFVISPLCWCIYDEYIKNYNVEDENRFEIFLKYANYITGNIQQEAYNKKVYDDSGFDREIINPYVLTIKKVINIYSEKVKNRYSRNIYNEIIKWLNKLNPLILSEECFEFEDAKGKEREMASSKEFYYQHMTKALEITEDFDNCVKIAEIALNVIDKFHYRNKIWIELRLHYSKCLIAQNQEEAISHFEKFARKNKIWFIWYRLSSICYKFGKLDKCLYFGSIAIVTEYTDEHMVNLFYTLGVLWHNKGDILKAKEFFQAAAYYRYINTWVISEELGYYITEYKINIKNHPNRNNIIKICEELSGFKTKDKYEYGIIKKILPHKGYGFIETKMLDKDVYFKLSELKMGVNAVPGKKVKYTLIKIENKYIAKHIKEVN